MQSRDSTADVDRFGRAGGRAPTREFFFADQGAGGQVTGGPVGLVADSLEETLTREELSRRCLVSTHTHAHAHTTHVYRAHIRACSREHTHARISIIFITSDARLARSLHIAAEIGDTDFVRKVD